MSSQESPNNPPVWVVGLLAKDLSPAEYRTWNYIYWRQGGNGSAWPSQEMIAADLRLSRRAVQMILQRLAARGWITVKWSGPGRGHSRHYTITAPEKAQEMRQLGGGKGARDAPIQAVKGANDDMEKAQQLRPNTIQGTQTTLEGCGENTKEPPSSPEAPRKRKTRKVRATDYAPDFERFWSEYPKKVGKLEAFKEWQAIDPDAAIVEKILLAVKAWARSEQWTKDGGRFIVYPVRFLKRRRFEDELPCSPEPQKGDLDWAPDPDDPELEERMAAIAEKQGARA